MQRGAKKVIICGATRALKHADRQEVNDTTIPTCLRNKQREELKEESEQAIKILRVQGYVP